LVLTLAFAGVAFAQDYSEPPPDGGTIPVPPGTVPSPPDDTPEEGQPGEEPADEGTDAGSGLPECVTDGQAGTFGADCQAFTVNQSARPTGWAILGEDDTHVYRFRFSAYRDPGSDDDPDEEGGGDDPQIAAERNDVLVLFRTDPQDAALMSFFTADQFRNGGDPFGAATVGGYSVRGDYDDEPDDDSVSARNDYATWKGNLSESGTYYAVVEGTGNQSGPVMYNIEVQGGGVTDFTFANEEPGQAPFEDEGDE
jgi:hypothetical protein